MSTPVYVFGGADMEKNYNDIQWGSYSSAKAFFDALEKL
jgi:hypothetical protein